MKSALASLIESSAAAILDQVIKNDGLRHAALKYAVKAAYKNSMEDAYPVIFSGNVALCELIHL
jgi:hypothetical protein